MLYPLSVTSKSRLRTTLAVLLLTAGLLVGCAREPRVRIVEVTVTPSPTSPSPTTGAFEVPLTGTPASSATMPGGAVRGWAVLAEKDDYSDVDMNDLLVDYIGISHMRQALEDSGWAADHIHEVREFDRETLRDELDWLAENADEDDVVLLYVAAHGKYLKDVLIWDEFFAADWEEIPSFRRLLVVDSCQAANYTGVVAGDPKPHLSIAAVAGDEYGWSGLEEEGLPIIGGVFTHYFAAAFGDPDADTDGDGSVSAQEAALMAEDQQRTYMHDVVFAVPEFVEMYHDGGTFPDRDPSFPDVVVDDAIGEPLYLALDAYPSPTPTPGPTAVTVCATGCDFATIQAAIDDAGTTTGDIISVTDAIHTEASITVHKDVTIQGQGASNTIVQAHATADGATDRVFFITNGSAELAEVGATVTIRDMTIRHGNPDLEPLIPGVRRAGGGIVNQGTLTLEGVVVRDNTASCGGGIYSAGTLTLTNCTVRGNTADGIDKAGQGCGSGGGIMHLKEGTTVLVNSTVSDNRAAGKGGGIKCSCAGTMTLVNSTVSGNSTDGNGGGIYGMGTLNLTHCTVSGNRVGAGGKGGGVYVRGTLNYTNSIIANSLPGGDCVIGSGDRDTGAIGANTNNLVEGNGCNPAYSGDPMLDALADNGGPSTGLRAQSSHSGQATWTHALLPGSPALDTIPAGECTVGTDQRGVPRPQGAGCDVGAFELELQTEKVSSYWPTQGWRTSTPEEQGMDSERLADMLNTIQEQEYDVDSVSVIRHGTMVADATVYPFRPGSRHIIRSCTKSIISALVGIAIDEGYIESVHQPVLDFFPGRTVANLDANKEAMTLEHVLTMATGLECRDSYLYNWRGLHQMEQSKDWVQFMLDLRMAEEPGTRFEYCNGASFLLSAILQETTGMSALAFAEEHLFGPLGITGVDWPSNPQGITIGWGELHMLPHDMAKIGYLYLNEGRWDTEQVVPAAWVRASTHKHISATLEDGYGYQWWVADAGVYLALGYAGQFIFVVPEQDMVVVFTSDLSESDFYVPQALLNDFIIPAARSSTPLPENPDGVMLLESRIKALANP